MDEDFPDTAVLVARKKLALRNLAAMQAQGQPTGPYLRKLMGQGQSMASVADPYADTPEDSARKESMNSMRLIGGRQVAPMQQQNTSEVQGGGVPEARALQQQFADPNMLAARMKQAQNAETARGKMEKDPLTGRPLRPTVASNNEKRFVDRMRKIQLMNDIQNAPMLAQLQAQHGLNPLQQAQADEHRATAAAIRAGIPPGAQQGPAGPLAAGAAPGAQQGPISVGPPSMWQRYLDWSHRNFIY